MTKNQLPLEKPSEKTTTAGNLMTAEGVFFHLCFLAHPESFNFFSAKLGEGGGGGLHYGVEDKASRFEIYVSYHRVNHDVS